MLGYCLDCLIHGCAFPRLRMNSSRCLIGARSRCRWPGAGPAPRNGAGRRRLVGARRQAGPVTQCQPVESGDALRCAVTASGQCGEKAALHAALKCGLSARGMPYTMAAARDRSSITPEKDKTTGKIVYLTLRSNDITVLHYGHFNKLWLSLVLFYNNK